MQKVSKPMLLAHRQLGQGMAEYIIIVALIAVAAIGVFEHLGGVIHQTGCGKSPWSFQVEPVVPLRR